MHSVKMMSCQHVNRGQWPEPFYFFGGRENLEAINIIPENVVQLHIRVS